MNESCHIWMSHVTYEWVMSHMHKSCHTCINRVSCECVVSHMNESCPIWLSHATQEWVTSYMYEGRHIRMSHVVYEWIVPHISESRQICMSQVTYECEAHANPHVNHMSWVHMPTLHGSMAALVSQKTLISLRYRKRYRVAKTHRIPYLYMSFFARVTYI